MLKSSQAASALMNNKYAAMAESGTIRVFAKEQSEIAALKETLCAQQKLLQKLYNELEVEREASSTAASEALSMILRLQGEKAAVKMEAEQYKRLVEEKMCHAEESLSMFEDLIYQKEMEVAALDYQVQAYRYKLLSMGCADPGIGEIRFPENLLQRNEDINAQSLGRRNSAPPVSLRNAYQKRGLSEREDSSSPDRDLISTILEERAVKEASDQGSDMERSSSGAGTISYFEQIRRLDERVREIAGVNSASLGSETSFPSPFSQLSPRNSSDATRLGSMAETDQVKSHTAYNEMNNDSTSTSGVLDVFEVPQVDRNLKESSVQPEFEGKAALLADDRLQRPDSVPQEALKSEVKDNIDWLKNLLLSAREKNYCRSGETAVGCHLAIVQPTASVSLSQPNPNQQNRASEIIEVGSRDQTEESDARAEELNLLNGIKEQLNAIQAEIKSLKTYNSVRKENLATVSYMEMEVSLMEAMLHFWL